MEEVLYFLGRVGPLVAAVGLELFRQNLEWGTWEFMDNLNRLNAAAHTQSGLPPPPLYDYSNIFKDAEYTIPTTVGDIAIAPPSGEVVYPIADPSPLKPPPIKPKDPVKAGPAVINSGPIRGTSFPWFFKPGQKFDGSRVTPQRSGVLYHSKKKFQVYL